MLSVNPPNEVLVSAVAEGSVGRHFAVAEFIVATLGHVEGNRTVPSHDPLALAIAERRNLSVAAPAPVVHLSSVQVDVSGEQASEGGHGGRSVLAFLVRATLSQGSHFLLWEISNIIHGDFGPGSGRFKNLGSLGHVVSFVGLHLRTCRTNINQHKSEVTLS